jgi:hypothetical protein
MSRRTRVRLFALLVVLGVTAGILGAPVPNAHAFPVCCTVCDNNYNKCLAGLIYPACHQNQSCCAAQVDPCWDTCNTNC